MLPHTVAPHNELRLHAPWGVGTVTLFARVRAPRSPIVCSTAVLAF
jgi:hypothetical protein